MSAKCPLICSAVELWYKMMLEIRNQSELAENHIKRKAAGYQRLSSNWLWLFMAAYKPSFPDAENIKIAYIIDVQIIVRDMKCVGDILGTEFCWPKEKKSKYRIAFYSISEVPFPKDMKNLCNPRKRSIIGV